MKKLRLCILIAAVILLAACGKEEDSDSKQKELGENQIYVYYVNSDKTGIVPEIYTIDREEPLADTVSKIINNLFDVEATEEIQSPIPDGLTYLGSALGEKYGRLEVSFNIVYDAINADTLLFFKASIVKTLLQLEDVNSVSLSLTDVASTNEDTATVTENFDQDSFTMSFGNESGYKQKGAIVLYFANQAGEALKEYRKSVEISNTTSLDRLVIESLIEGPGTEEYTATIPKSTTIRNILVKDGICYVDLSDEFYNADNPLKNDIIIYSIVNSLVELPTVSKVQFLRNGEKQEFYRETLPFDGIFERNLDLIEQEEAEK